MSGIGKTMMTLGVLMFIGAVGWWYAFFEQFLGRDVKQASECFYFTTDACSWGQLAARVTDVANVTDVPAYSPVLLWVAVGIFVVGLLFMALAPLRR